MTFWVIFGLIFFGGCSKKTLGINHNCTCNKIISSLWFFKVALKFCKMAAFQSKRIGNRKCSNFFFCFCDFYLHIFSEPNFCEIATFHSSNPHYYKRESLNFLTGFLRAHWTDRDIWYTKSIQNLMGLIVTRPDFTNFASPLNNEGRNLPCRAL